ncbi:Vitamin B12 import system permease protein BtuC [Streptomyces violaceorubidus]
MRPVVVASRLPRMTAGLLVGAVLGMAGAVLQAVSRNVLASPDTLAVNAGSYLALGLAGATGVSLPMLASSGIAFAGGLAAAAVVLGLSGLGTGTVRLVLAGTALMLGLNSMMEGLLLLFPEQTEGLYQWNQGSIGQNGFDGVLQMLPIALIGLAGLMLMARRADALALGEDAARGLGVPVRATRVTVVVLAALLSAAAVTLAGPIGFVGLCAPALVRPLARRFRGFTRSRTAMPRRRSPARPWCWARTYCCGPWSRTPVRCPCRRVWAPVGSAPGSWARWRCGCGTPPGPGPRTGCGPPAGDSSGDARRPGRGPGGARDRRRAGGRQQAAAR